MNTKKEYIAPKLTEFSYKPEDGFALSLMNSLLGQDEFDNSNQEDWYWNEEGDNQFGDNNWNWNDN